MMIDEVDLKILKLLKENSRMQWKDIGMEVHLTGQAVGNRIRKLEDIGVIERYTITINNMKIGMPLTAFITVFLESSNHASFQSFFNSHDAVSGVHRISGEGCYLLTAHFASNDDLESFLEGILKYGNYRLTISVGAVKN